MSISLARKYIAADAISGLPDSGNQETAHESMYLTETISEPYDIEELSDGTFPIYFKLMEHYQWEESILTKNQYEQNIKRVPSAEVEAEIL